MFKKVLFYGVCFLTLVVVSCTSAEYDNPNDCRGSKCVSEISSSGGGDSQSLSSSSAGDGQSSSSAATAQSSSSANSADVGSSSGTAASSSSNEEQGGDSSSSLSSSSAGGSSSSGTGQGGGSSSSKVTVCTAANNTSTQYCSNGTMRDYGSVEDADGNTYKTVVIGTQTWMAENLNYRGAEPDTTGECYNNDTANCDTYGRLYTWTMAMDLPAGYNNELIDVENSQGICPDGWHVPSNDDWNALMVFIHSDKGPSGSTSQSSVISTHAGKHLKAMNGWNDYSSTISGNGLDTYGFSALPGGYRLSSNSLNGIGNESYWWSSSLNSRKDYAYFVYATRNSDYFNLNEYYKIQCRSIRCVKD